MDKGIQVVEEEEELESLKPDSFFYQIVSGEVDVFEDGGDNATNGYQPHGVTFEEDLQGEMDGADLDDVCEDCQDLRSNTRELGNEEGNRSNRPRINLTKFKEKYIENLRLEQRMKFRSVEAVRGQHIGRISTRQKE